MSARPVGVGFTVSEIQQALAMFVVYSAVECCKNAPPYHLSDTSGMAAQIRLC